MNNHIIVAIVFGSLIPIVTFIWLYFDAKGKRDTILEISKNINDSDKIEELIQIFEERKKQPLDYRRNGIITTMKIIIMTTTCASLCLG